MTRPACDWKCRASGKAFGECGPVVSFPSHGKHGVWRSLVARLVWDQEVAGSNPAAPIE